MRSVYQNYRFLCILTALAMWPAPSGAKTLFADDFQDNSVLGWAANPGRGEVKLSSYQGNISLQLTRDASVVRQVATERATRILVSAAFAVQNLEGDDACIIEVSEDGAAWRETGRIADGDDDGVTLHRVSSDIALNTVTESFFLGVRILGNSTNDTCWVDDISVVATRDPESLSHSIPESIFFGAKKPELPFSTRAFAPPIEAAAPQSHISGRLMFAGGPADHFELLKDDFNYAPTSQPLSTLPSFSVDLVHDGVSVIPIQRGPQPGTHAEWEWIFEPGAIWRDEDYGRSKRVSMPFALQERNANCIHNGLMSFLIDEAGVASHMVYQIGSETCAYMQFNMWGAAAVIFEPRAHPNAADVVVAFETEVAARIPKAPAQTLPFADHFGSPDEVSPAAMTAFGYTDGVQHYIGGCMTRFGIYPFCSVLDLPSYSLAKSIVAGIAAMRLEKLYPGAMTSLIADYVPQCAGDAWRDVTFSHALNMSTGLYDSDVYEEDESGEKMLSFFLAETHADKIETACTAFPRRQAPEELFVYYTADTYILGAAMNAFLREKTGDASADFFDDVVAPVWSAIGVSQTALRTRRTYDSVRQPFTGWGVTLHGNDIALIASFLQGGGIIDAEPMLDPAMLAAALQRSPEDRGLRAVVDAQRYKNGFWAWNAGPSIGCDGDKWIPAMSGYGGLAVAMFPNGASYYYVSDGGAYAWRRAAAASNQIDRFCEGSP